MTRVSKITILFLLVAGMVLAASAGTLGGYAGSSASVSGDGMAIANSWDADYEAGYDLVVTADHPGASSSVSMTVNSQDGNDDIMVQVKANELKACAKVMGPSEGTGFAMAIASARALATGGVNGDASITQDGGLTLETWLFASAHTYAGSEGVTATASSTASGTAKASGSTPEGSAMAESKGKVTASSSATYPGVYGDSILVDGGSTAVSAAMIGAAAHAEEGAYFAGYPAYMYTPISLFHPFEPFDYIVYPYFYPGNGLATANMLDGTGYAKSTASGSATASADMPFDFVTSSTGCMPVAEPVVKTSSSGTVASGVAGTETMAGAVSGINSWAFVDFGAVEDGALQEGYLPAAQLDTGSTIFAAGGVIDESSGSYTVSSGSKKKPVTVDTATFSASGKSSGAINIGDVLFENAVFQPPMMADLDASTSGSISGKVTQDGGGASGSINAIAARALGYPEIIEDLGIEWGILLPTVEELNMITWELGAGEGQLYSMLGSASGSMECGGGTGTTSATVSGSAVASGEGAILSAFPAFSDGGNEDDLIVPMPGISGQTSAKGTIKSSTTAMPFGDAATTSQILATGGEGPLFGYFAIDYFDMEEEIGFASEVGGMAYLTTMDYALDKGLYTVSGTSKSKKCPVTSATSSVSGQADFEGSSVMVNEIAVVEYLLSTSDEMPDGSLFLLVDGEDHQASASAKGTVTGSASASNAGEADTGSLILSAAAAELFEIDDGDGINNALVDYSLIYSDSSAMSGGGQTASAKGTADGSTTATSSLDYTDFVVDDSIYKWQEYLESTTTAKGKVLTDAKATGSSGAISIGTLKSFNAIEPASMDIDPTDPGLDMLDGAIINDDSVLASGARAWGGSGQPIDKSSATTTLSGSTCSEGSLDFTIWEILLPDAGLAGDLMPKPEPIESETEIRFLDGKTGVSNSDKVTVSGSGKNGLYDGQAFTFACADQMTVMNPFKEAVARSVFGAGAETITPGADLTATASISNVKTNAYADPDGAMAKVGFTGGKASAKFTPTTATAPPATYSSLTTDVSTCGGIEQVGVNYANFGLGEAYSFQDVIADSRTTTPSVSDPPDIPEIFCPVVFWP